MNPVGPRGVYDEAKRFAEAMTMAYHRFHRVDTRIVRIFNTYGPRMRPTTAGWCRTSWSRRWRASRSPSMATDRRPARSAIVSDLVDGIVRLFHSNEADPMNIGNPNEFTVRQLAEMTIRLTGSTSRIIQEPLPTDDPKVRKPDITQRAHPPGLGSGRPAAGGVAAHHRLLPDGSGT